MSQSARAEPPGFCIYLSRDFRVFRIRNREPRLHQRATNKIGEWFQGLLGQYALVHKVFERMGHQRFVEWFLEIAPLFPSQHSGPVQQDHLFDVFPAVKIKKNARANNQVLSVMCNLVHSRLKQLHGDVIQHVEKERTEKILLV